MAKTEHYYTQFEEENFIMFITELLTKTNV